FCRVAALRGRATAVCCAVARGGVARRFAATADWNVAGNWPRGVNDHRREELVDREPGDDRRIVGVRWAATAVHFDVQYCRYRGLPSRALGDAASVFDF